MNELLYDIITNNRIIIYKLISLEGYSSNFDDEI